MSNILTGLVAKKRCGGAVRKSILLCLAGLAGNDGAGIKASMRYLAAMAEVSERAFQSHFRDFESEGLIVETGRADVTNGYIWELAIDIDALENLPDLHWKGQRHDGKSPRKPRSARTRCTGAGDAPVHAVHPSGARDAPLPVHAVHPIKVVDIGSDIPPVVPQPGDAAPAQSAKTKKAYLPLPFTPRDRERAIAFNELRMTGAEFETCLAEFIDWASTKGRRVAGEPNWNRTFEHDLRRTAANWKTSFRKQTPHPFKAYANDASAQAATGVTLPTAPDWWAAAAAAIHERDAAAWRSYGASAVPTINESGERVVFAASSIAGDRLAKIVEALETTGLIVGPIFVKHPSHANVPSTN